MKIDEDELSGGKNEDTEEVLCCFLERELCFMDARRVEFQRVHRIGKSKEGKPRSILARIANKFFPWVTGLRIPTFRFIKISYKKSSVEEKYRWSPSRLPRGVELLPPSTHHSQISCLLEGNYGQ